MILSHKIRLIPTFKQEMYFRRCCGIARFAYNWALAEWKRQYEVGEKPNGLALKVQFNAIRREQFPWTFEVHRDCTARSFTNIQWAFNNFFKKMAKYPRFKKKGRSRDSFYIANDRFTMFNKHARLPFVGLVKTCEPLRWHGKVMGATVCREADLWFLVVMVDVGELRLERTANGIVGVDLGIATSVTLSTGEKIDGPKALRKAQKKLIYLSRVYSRRVNGSKNREKATHKLARLHQRISNLRSDFLHKLTTRLCRENQAVGIESLYVRGMVRNHRLARAISDEGWGELRRQLEYKRPIYGTEIEVKDRWFPSSKTCFDCGHVVDILPLSVREWICPKCGVIHDRDDNAAQNLKPIPKAIRELTPVETEALARSRGRVKLPSSKQEPYREHLCLQER